MYEIAISNQAKKKLKKLSPDTQTRILNALERIRIRPEKHVRKIVDSKAYRLRVGDQRVILDIMEDKQVILAMTIKHRKNAYKKR